MRTIYAALAALTLALTMLTGVEYAQAARPFGTWPTWHFATSTGHHHCNRHRHPCWHAVPTPHRHRRHGCAIGLDHHHYGICAVRP